MKGVYLHFLIAFLLIILVSFPAFPQVQVDIDQETASRAANNIEIRSLSVNDSAYVYSAYCIKDGGLYMTGWATPANYADTTWNATGIITQIKILPGRKVEAKFVDARQAQLKAQGNSKYEMEMSKEEYNRLVREKISSFFIGRFFDSSPMCDEILKANPLQKPDLYAVESLNGFKKLSELLKSVEKTPELVAPPKKK
jgi:hypothetical protein